MHILDSLLYGKAIVMILSFRTDRSRQTVQTQISLIRVYIVCNSLCIFWVHHSTVNRPCSNLRVITANFSGVQIFRIFTVHCWNFRAITADFSSVPIFRIFTATWSVNGSPQLKWMVVQTYFQPSLSSTEFCQKWSHTLTMQTQGVYERKKEYHLKDL